MYKFLQEGGGEEGGGGGMKTKLVIGNIRKGKNHNKLRMLSMCEKKDETSPPPAALHIMTYYT